MSWGCTGHTHLGPSLVCGQAERQRTTIFSCIARYQSRLSSHSLSQSRPCPPRLRTRRKIRVSKRGQLACRSQIGFNLSGAPRKGTEILEARQSVHSNSTHAASENLHTVSPAPKLGTEVWYVQLWTGWPRSCCWLQRRCCCYRVPFRAKWPRLS